MGWDGSMCVDVAHNWTLGESGIGVCVLRSCRIVFRERQFWGGMGVSALTSRIIGHCDNLEAEMHARKAMQVCRHAGM